MRKEPLTLPEPDGSPLTMNEKVYVPVKEHPDVSWFFWLLIISNVNIFEIERYWVLNILIIQL